MKDPSRSKVLPFESLEVLPPDPVRSEKISCISSYTFIDDFYVTICSYDDGKFIGSFFTGKLRKTTVSIYAVQQDTQSVSMS